MFPRALRRMVGLFLLAFSLVMVGWSHWPASSATRTLAVSSVTVKLPEPVVTVLPPALVEERQLLLSWPPKVRVGDVESIRLALRPASQDRAGSPEVDSGDSSLNETMPALPPANEGRIFVEARLELAGMQYTPTGLVSEALYPGASVAFFWNARPTQRGIYAGTVWVYLVFSLPGESTEIRRVLSAQQIEIEAVNFLGMSGSSARVIGLLLLLVGAALSLDSVFLQLWERMKK